MNTLHMIKKQSNANIDSPRPVNLSVAHQTNKTNVSVHSNVDKANASVQSTANNADASLQPQLLINMTAQSEFDGFGESGEVAVDKVQDNYQCTRQ